MINSKDEQQLLKCNLIILYDHEYADDIFIIKNPSDEEIIRISRITPCKDFYKQTDPERDKLATEYDYCLEQYMCFVNLDNIVEIDYDDEDLRISEYFQSLKDLFIECYNILTCDATDPGFHLNYNVIKPENTPEYELRSLALEKVVDNDKSPIQSFFTIDDWEKNDKNKVEKRLSEMKQSLTNFKTFVQKMKEFYINSFCDCDSGWSHNFIDLKNEKKILGSKTTDFHFINSYDDYKQEIEKIKNNHKQKQQLKHQVAQQRIKTDSDNSAWHIV